jgi:hypothetical protein
LKGKSQATEPTVIQSTRSGKENKKAKERKKKQWLEKDTEGGDGIQPNSKFVRSKIQNVKKRNRQLLCCMFVFFVVFLL